MSTDKAHVKAYASLMATAMVEAYGKPHSIGAQGIRRCAAQMSRRAVVCAQRAQAHLDALRASSSTPIGQYWPLTLPEGTDRCDVCWELIPAKKGQLYHCCPACFLSSVAQSKTRLVAAWKGARKPLRVKGEPQRLPFLSMPAKKATTRFSRNRSGR